MTKINLPDGFYELPGKYRAWFEQPAGILYVHLAVILDGELVSIIARQTYSDTIFDRRKFFKKPNFITYLKWFKEDNKVDPLDLLTQAYLSIDEWAEELKIEV